MPLTKNSLSLSLSRTHTQCQKRLLLKGEPINPVAFDAGCVVRDEDGNIMEEGAGKEGGIKAFSFNTSQAEAAAMMEKDPGSEGLIKEGAASAQ